ncbi:MAG: radical SAM protein [Spirochaetes bacterium]|nr:radical SAM protein [Spirochaetota bacterium]MBN2770592.1 radical SAM protein [Spirochaetota bacterium]
MKQNITGISKVIFLLQIKIKVLFHYTVELFQGKINIVKFVRLLRRLLYLVKKLSHNKFVRINGETKIDLYIPGFGSKAFWTSCNKFKEFKKSLPCSTVLISVTNACKNRCSHCYQRFDKGKDISIDKLTNVVKQLQDMGIAFFNIEGGDPFIKFDRLKAVCEQIDDRSSIWINSSGDGITEERLQILKEYPVKAIMFPLTYTDKDTYDRFFKRKGAFDTMIKAVDLCHNIKIPVAINTCPPAANLHNGEFDRVMEKAKDLGAIMVQVIKLKEAGAALNSDIVDYTKEDLILLNNKVYKYNNSRRHKDFPSISAQIFEESKEMFGCTAGGTERFYINAKGDVQPCEFLNISFGNIADQPFEKIYSSMKSVFADARDCWLCEKYQMEIFNLFKKNGILPLSADQSKKIYQHWDRGQKTELYTKIIRM